MPKVTSAHCQNIQIAVIELSDAYADAPACVVATECNVADIASADSFPLSSLLLQLLWLLLFGVCVCRSCSDCWALTLGLNTCLALALPPGRSCIGQQCSESGLSFSNVCPG